MGLKNTEGFFRGYNNTELYYQTWSNESAKANLIITHGLGEHSGCYERLAHGLQPSEFNIYAWDQRGHGKSEGKRGVIESFDAMAEDLKFFIAHIQKQTSNAPLILLGHSMGGLVTAHYICKFEKETPAIAWILSSPLFGVAVKVPAIKLAVAKVLAKILPNLTMDNELIFEHITRDPKVVEEYQRDTLRHTRVSSNFLVEMYKTIDSCMAHAPQIRLPFLSQLAGADKIVSRPKGEEFFYKVGSKDKVLKVYEGYYHETYNDIGRDVPYSDLKTWTSAQLK